VIVLLLSGDIRKLRGVDRRQVAEGTYFLDTADGPEGEVATAIGEQRLICCCARQIGRVERVGDRNILGDEIDEVAVIADRADLRGPRRGGATHEGCTGESGDTHADGLPPRWQHLPDGFLELVDTLLELRYVCVVGVLIFSHVHTSSFPIENRV